MCKKNPYVFCFYSGSLWLWTSCHQIGSSHGWTAQESSKVTVFYDVEIVRNGAFLCSKRWKFITGAQAKSSKPSGIFRKLFRPKVIWVQCFQWPNTTTCGKKPCACVTPELYFVFACCSETASTSASTRKRKHFDPCACAYTCVKAVFTVK